MEPHQDLSLDLQSIVVNVGSVDFRQYENLKRQASDLAERIKSVEVDEENIKQSKKLLAAVNKRLKELEDHRIAVKKSMMEPYTIFEIQVKEIVSIVKEADEIVRQQVRDLEEMERDRKSDQIREIFDKRIKHYSFRDLFSFTDFLKPKHLNKTTSIEAVEKDVIEFLEKLTKDLKAIEAMPNAKQILSAYLSTKDLAEAISIMDQERIRQERIEASKAIKVDKGANPFHFTVFHEKDMKLIKLFCEQNDINYEMRNF
jgi:uncharacterized protein DUF1351